MDLARPPPENSTGGRLRRLADHLRIKQIDGLHWRDIRDMERVLGFPGGPY